MSEHDSPGRSPAFIHPLPLELDQIGKHRAGLRRLVGRLHYLTIVDSTNSYARRLAEKGAPEGEIVIAEAQSQGRGRAGRAWSSPSHANLYTSVILRTGLPPAKAPQLTLMAAVALAECISSFIADRPTIKWPNDILVNDKKIAGILTESNCNAKGIDFVILGIGLNVNFPLELMPENIRERATSLMILGGQTFSRERVFWRLIQHLDRCYGMLEESGWRSIAPRWESYFGLRGKAVRVDSVGEITVGKAMGIDDDGALIIEDENGRSRRIIAGDVSALDG